MNADTLAATGVSLMPAADLVSSLGADKDMWVQFAKHWDELVPDPYAAELGMQRLRRYGHYMFKDGVAEPMPIGAFIQPENSNPLYVERDRQFEPLTDAFTKDPLLAELLKVLDRFANTLDDAQRWNGQGASVPGPRLGRRRGPAHAGGPAPGTLLLGDDRRTVYGVSPIRPLDNTAPALRDVLVITFAS